MTLEQLNEAFKFGGACGFTTQELLNRYLPALTPQDFDECENYEATLNDMSSELEDTQQHVDSLENTRDKCVDMLRSLSMRIGNKETTRAVIVSELQLIIKRLQT